MRNFFKVERLDDKAEAVRNFLQKVQTQQK